MEQKTNYLFGMHPVFEAISAGKNIEKVLLKKGLTGEQFQQLFSLLQEKQIAFQFVPVEKLDKITRARHQGVIAVIPSVEYVSLEEAVEKAFAKKENPLFLMLDGVSDVRNFGAIARSAECAGVDCIILPAKGGASITPDAIKTSAGALLRIDVCKVPNLKTAVFYLQQSDVQIVTATEKAEGYLYDVDLTGATAIVMGAEDKGISDEVLRLCDNLAAIPLVGNIGSLNVSVAAGIMMYEGVRQRLK